MAATLYPNRLVLIRHGETVGNSSIRYYGRTDVALSDVGRAQLRAAAEWLCTHHGLADFGRVFASPLSRAAEGARLIAGPHSAPIEIDEFAEVDFGIFEGLTAEEIRERHPAEFERWNRDRLASAYTYPGGESRMAFIARVERGVERMLRLIAAPRPFASGSRNSANGGAALVVAHRGVIRVIMRRLAGIEPRIELGSIQILERRHGRAEWHAHALDLVPHLAKL